jgi:hypothetical protein
VAAHVSASRRRIEKILNGEDRRLLVIMRAVRNSSVLFIGVSKICFFASENAGK